MSYTATPGKNNGILGVRDLSAVTQEPIAMVPQAPVVSKNGQKTATNQGVPSRQCSARRIPMGCSLRSGG